MPWPIKSVLIPPANGRHDCTDFGQILAVFGNWVDRPGQKMWVDTSA